MPTDDNAVIETVDTVSPDISAYEAKIAAQESTIAERDTSIGTLTAELSASKAANYDLLMSVPKDVGTPVVSLESESNDSDFDFDDLFEQKV